MSIPYRADHVGSLLRPAHLHEARAQRAAGQINAVELKAVEDECIRAAIAMQESVGLQCATDGEMRRRYWHYDFLCGLDGIEEVEQHQGPTFRGGNTFSSLQVIGKISNPNGVMLDHFRFLRDNTKVTPKFCIPSPSLAYHRGGRDLIDRSAYPDITAFWADLEAAYRAEIAMLHGEGCRYLQLDDTTFAMLCDPKVRQQMADRGDDATALITRYGQAIAASIQDKPADMTITVHMCRGNMASSWIAEGGYEPVAEAMFAETPVDGFFMEWESERAGGFEPLRYAPKGRKIVLGLISSKFPEMEAIDDLKRRVDEAAKYVAMDDLCISPQCGFASTVEGNRISEDDQKRKLALTVEAAAKIWG
jgi:5-methyltetrahydropteroyltriglutamate--homocysteine methyltransferase